MTSRYRASCIPTAEWTKFSPTIAHALTGETDSQDIDAPEIHFRCRQHAHSADDQALFDRPVAQSTVIDKRDIEREVLAFI